MQSDHGDVQQNDCDGRNPHIDMGLIQNIEERFEKRNDRDGIFIGNESLSDATFTNS